MDGGVVEKFIEALHSEARRAWATESDPARLGAALLAAETRSGLQLPSGEFAQYLGQRLRSLGDLERLELGDLHLAFGCVLCDAQALSTFEERYGRLFEITNSPIDGAELRDDLLAFILAPRSERGPRIADYRGRGKLRTWLEVAIGRRVIDLRRTARRHAGHTVAFDETTDQLALHPEVAYLKRCYRDAAEMALRVALAELDARSRSVLRQHYALGLSTRQLAAMYGQHRSTINRRLVDARSRVLTRVREYLAEQMAVPVAELDSVLRWVGGSLQVTPARFWSTSLTEAQSPPQSSTDGEVGMLRSSSLRS